MCIRRRFLPRSPNATGNKRSHFTGREDETIHFGREPELRQAPTEARRWLRDLAKRGGGPRLLSDGRVVTDQGEPHERDWVLRAKGAVPQDEAAAGEGRDRWPFVPLALGDEELCERSVAVLDRADRKAVPKGIRMVSC